MRQDPILVVGAGPTGTLLAIELARRGVPVRIIEKIPARSTESRANGIQSRTLELFSAIGIADELAALGNEMHALNFYFRGKRLFRIDFGRLGAPYPFILIVPQYQTQRLLDRRLENLGVSIERGVELEGLSQTADRLTAVTRNASGAGESFSCPYLAGCDGAHSAVRHALGMPFEGAGYGQDWLGADVDVEWDLPEDEGHVFASPTGVLACFPFGNGHWRIGAAQVADRAAERQAPDLAEVRTLVARRGPVGMAIANPSWLGVFRASRRSAPDYRSGRVFLAGDAVHIHSPAAAQGMNTGLGDAYNLGWKLASVSRGLAPDSLLDSYQSERAPVAASVIQLTHALVLIMGGRSVSARILRDRLLPVASALPFAQRKASRRMGQLSISYRGGPLASTHRGFGPSTWRAVKPGDRVPQVRGLHWLGSATSLFDLMTGPEHTLLLFPRTPNDTELAEDVTRRLDPLTDGFKVFVVARRRPGGPHAENHVLDPGGALHRCFGRPGFCLIRSDGYLGSCGSLSDLSALGPWPRGAW